MKNHFLAVAKITILLMTYLIVLGQSFSARAQGERIEKVDLPFDAAILKNDVRSPGLREIYVVLHKNHFNAKDLTFFFKKTAERFPQPLILRITTSSTKDDITNAFENDHRSGSDIPIEGLTAKYHRNSYREFFYYITDELNRLSHVRTIKDDTKSKSDLIEAIKDGYEDRFKLLIKSGIDINLLDDSHNSALAWACISLQNDFIETLLQKGADVNLPNNQGVTPLMYISMTTEAASLQLLIKARANLNLRDKSGNTALMYAVNFKSVQSVKELLRNCADKTIKNDDGQTALDLAKQLKIQEIIELLM